MNWLKKRLMPRKARPRGTTTEPEPKTNWENLAEDQRRTGVAARDLFATLRGKRRSPVRVCQYGHQVPPGSTTCSHGHYVG